MVSYRGIAAALPRESGALRDELKTRLPSGARLRYPQHKRWPSETGGQCTIVANWPRRPRIELWLDRATDEDRYRFWVGFASELESKVRGLIEALPDELAPTAALLTDADIRLVKNSRTRWAYKAARKRELTRPYVEIYRKSRENFFGMYDWGGPGTSDRLALDVWKAATFIQAVVTATVTASADVDDEFETAREGALDERYVRHRHREKKTASGRSRPF